MNSDKEGVSSGSRFCKTFTGQHNPAEAMGDLWYGETPASSTARSPALALLPHPKESKGGLPVTLGARAVRPSRQGSLGVTPTPAAVAAVTSRARHSPPGPQLGWVWSAMHVNQGTVMEVASCESFN